ncbi:hypothetical protein [Burkholderia ubonensis]|uniref:hypothetical protein n=1 Tax=Burkholderia ubonensis TaxID=101571 RepID=UPI0012FC954E|nr:hypothetical protein [Burkholderia ubonensis]
MATAINPWYRPRANPTAHATTSKIAPTASAAGGMNCTNESTDLKIKAIAVAAKIPTNTPLITDEITFIIGVPQ